MATTPKDPLASLRARIHIAQKQMGLNEDEYRALLTGVTGKNSTKEMSRQEMDRVLMECVRLGWKPAAPGVAACRTNPADNSLMSRNMRRPINWDDPGKNALYRKLYAMICEHDWNWSYVRGTAQKMFQEKKGGTVVLEWLTGEELHALVAAIQIHANRLTERR